MGWEGRGLRGERICACLGVFVCLLLKASFLRGLLLRGQLLLLGLVFRSLLLLGEDGHGTPCQSRDSGENVSSVRCGVYSRSCSLLNTVQTLVTGGIFMGSGGHLGSSTCSAYFCVCVCVCVCVCARARIRRSYYQWQCRRRGPSRCFFWKGARMMKLQERETWRVEGRLRGAHRQARGPRDLPTRR